MRTFDQSRPTIFRIFCAILVGWSLLRTAGAQEEAPLPVDNDPLVRLTDRETDLRLVEKFTKIVELKNRISIVSGFDPEVVNVSKVDKHPNQIRVHALVPGVTTLILVDEKNQPFTIEVFVIGDVRHLQAYIKHLFPHDAVTAVAVRDSVVLRGYVSRPEEIPRLMDIAKEFYPNVLNQMEVGGNQAIQLKVKVIEIDRTKMRQLGINFYEYGQQHYFANTNGALVPLGSLATPLGGPPDPEVVATKLATPTLTGGIVNSGWVFNAFVNALAQESLLKILANPILTTTNGQPANMLSGGEFPILVPQSLGTVTIQWKEYGVRLTAVPLLLGDGRVRLNLQPEVSQKDLSNSVTTNGLTVPALTTRRVNTSVEMRFGETFMLAGLIEEQELAQTFKVPGLGEIPWFGALWRNVSYQTTETELVILVTPVLASAMTDGQVPPGGPGMFTDAPTDRELYGYGLIEVPSYGDHCTNCGNYPPPIMDLDMTHGQGAPMITPVPIQELPPIHEPLVPLAPAPPASPAPVDSAAPRATSGVTSPNPSPSSPRAQAPVNGPSASGSTSGGGSTASSPSARYSPAPSIRQVSAQSSPFENNPVGQATAGNPAPPRSSGWTRPPAAPQQPDAVDLDGRTPAQSAAPSQPRASGVYSPQSGLFVPSVSGQ